MRLIRAIWRGLVWLVNVLADTLVILSVQMSMALRWSRRLRGWRVDTEQAFNEQVKIAARAVELHPHVRHVWKLGRQARILAVTAKMYDLLSKTTSEAVAVDCLTDSVGALGEVTLGYWRKSFRIELDPRRRAKVEAIEKAEHAQLP